MTGDERYIKGITELYFNYACCALLGEGRGEFLMTQLYDESPELYREFMNAARDYLTSVPVVKIELVNQRYRELQVIQGDLEKERSN